jgi:ABC-2 type transport system permease protein
MKVFLTLVKNDLGIAKNRKNTNPFWRRVYLYSGLVLGLALYTALLFNTEIKPNLIFFVPIFLLFSCFAVAMGLIKKEWQGNTAGWWLSLPYSRQVLLGAKFTAGFIRLLRNGFIALVISIILWLEGMILRPDIWSGYSMVETFIETCKAYVQMIFISPLLMAFGILIVVLNHSRLKPVSPIFIILFAGLMSFLFSTFFKIIFSTGSGIVRNFAIPGFSTGITYVIGIVSALIMAYSIFMLSAFILEKHVEI